MSISKRRRLLIVGDIHGFPETFAGLLDIARFEHHELRLADLGGHPKLRGENLHNHLFNEDGISHAVQTLREIEGRTCVGIGFSAGGTALWRAVKAGLDFQALICVSSTRLRLETSLLTIPTMALWGELDPSRPTEGWNDAVLNCWKIYAGKQHDFYRLDTLSSTSPLLTDIAAFVEDRAPAA